MPVNSTHPDYDASLPAWLRARDVLAGEDAVKAGGEKYLPRLESQTDEEYHAYRARASFFNASARAADGFLGLVCRRPPFIKIPEGATSPDPSPPRAERGPRRPFSGVGRALAEFVNDADMLGTSLAGYGQVVVSEVIAVGRAGTLVDWEGETEHRVYVSRYAAENILNWRTERINGRNLLTLVVLAERGASTSPRPSPRSGEGDDAFVENTVEQIRVLKLVPAISRGDGRRPIIFLLDELSELGDRRIV